MILLWLTCIGLDRIPQGHSPLPLKASILMLQVNNFQKAQDCLLPMGITSENVAHRFGVSRQEQDQAAVSFG